MDSQENTKIKRTPVVELFLTLREWVRFILRKWLILLIFSIIGCAIGIYIAYTTKPKFESTLTFSLDEGASNSMGTAMSLAAQFGLNLGGSGNDIFGGDNILTIINSRRAIEGVFLSVDSTDGNIETMANKYLRIINWKKKYANKPAIKDINFPIGLSKENFTYLQDSVLYILYVDFSKKNLRASHPDKRINSYEIHVTTLNEKFSKVFTDKLINFTSTLYTELKTKKSRQTIEVLESRVIANKGLTGASINNKVAAQDANLNPAFASAQAPIQKQQINVQAYGGAYAELYKNLELAKFQFLKETPLLQVIDAADYPMKKIKASKLVYGIVGGFVVFLIVFLLLAFLQFVKSVPKTQI
ncbi:MAG: hypothetical protein V4556_03905 [Bacteroidota bacterium]